MIVTFVTSLDTLSTPIIAADMREAVQSPWRLTLEMIDEVIVQLASLRAVLPIIEAQDVRLHIDVFESHKHVLEAIADGLRNGAQWRDRVRFESLRFVRLRDVRRFRQSVRRRQRWN